MRVELGSLSDSLLSNWSAASRFCPTIHSVTKEQPANAALHQIHLRPNRKQTEPQQQITEHQQNINRYPLLRTRIGLVVMLFEVKSRRRHKNNLPPLTCTSRPTSQSAQTLQSKGKPAALAPTPSAGDPPLRQITRSHIGHSRYHHSDNRAQNLSRLLSQRARTRPQNTRRKRSRVFHR